VKRFTVVWKPTAQDDLARLWLSAVDRAAVTDASEDIDRVLAWDPDELVE